MTSEIDFYRAAQIFVKEHGLNALSQAQSRIKHFENKADYTGVYAWKQIATAISQIQLQPQQDERIN